MRKISILIILTIVLQQLAEAQCCAPGNPVSGSEHTGIVPIKNIRLITFFRHSFSDTYYSESTPAEYQDSKAGFNYIGEVVSVGIAKKLAMEGEFGYYLKKYQHSEVLGRLSTHGFNTAIFSAKYSLLNQKGFEITLGAGAKIPLSNREFTDQFGIPYPQEIHPSTRAYGFVAQAFVSKMFTPLWKTVIACRYETNRHNNDNYRFGDIFNTSLFISRMLSGKWMLTLQLRNEYRLQDLQGETKYLFTGGDISFISPQVSYTFKNGITAAAIADLPLYRNYNGIQLGPKYAFGINIVKDICLQK